MIVHLNGELVDASAAQVSVFDRGFLFGDGVYEGLRATDGHMIGLGRHIQRMRDGLDETRIRGFDPASIRSLSDDLLEANSLRSAFVYWQVTRGAPRAEDPVRQRVPTEMTPTVFGYASPIAPITPAMTPDVRTARLAPDLRWKRGRLKSISLLGSVLAAIEAVEVGAEDAIMHADGLVSEATSANVLIARGGSLVTPDLDSTPILGGITREILLAAAPEIEERPLQVTELLDADEIMLAGTSSLVTSVTHLDGEPVGDAGAGPEAHRLLSALVAAVDRERESARLNSSHA